MFWLGFGGFLLYSDCFFVGLWRVFVGFVGFVLHRRRQALAPLSLKTLNLSFPSCFHLCPPQFFPSADTFQKALREEEKRRRKEEKRKEIRKGPRISRSQSEL